MTEDRGRRTEDGGQNEGMIRMNRMIPAGWDGKGRKADDGGQRTEDGGRRAEDGGQRTEERK